MAHILVTRDTKYSKELNSAPIRSILETSVLENSDFQMKFMPHVESELTDYRLISEHI